MSTNFIPPQVVSGTLKAGQVKFIDGKNVVCRVLAASAAFNICFDHGQSFPTNVGLGYQCLPGENFERVTLENTSAADLTFSVIVGQMRFEDNRLNIITGSSYVPVSEPVTKLVGQNISTLGAGANKVMTGAPAGQQYRRAGVVVSNADAALSLTVYDDVGGIVDFILPASSRYIPISGYVKISNDNGAAVACAIGEIWQMLP